MILQKGADFVTRKRRFGDRADGRKLRTIDPMSRIAVFIMKDRNDASNLYSDSIDTEKLEQLLGIPVIGVCARGIAAVNLL